MFELCRPQSDRTKTFLLPNLKIIRGILILFADPVIDFKWILKVQVLTKMIVGVGGVIFVMFVGLSRTSTNVNAQSLSL